MGTGTFIFHEQVIQSLLFCSASPARVYEDRVFDQTSYDPYKWTVKDQIEGGFEVHMSGSQPLTMRYSRPLPENLVRQCREVLAGWSWMSAILPGGPDRMAGRVRRLLDCQEVKDATASVLETSVLARNAFQVMLDETLADVYADFAELMKGRQNLMRFLT